MSGARGLIRDIVIIYICIRLVFVWLFGAKLDFALGVMIVLLGMSSVWFMLERILGHK